MNENLPCHNADIAWSYLRSSDHIPNTANDLPLMETASDPETSLSG